mgnify:CR=1 FL=1
MVSASTSVLASVHGLALAYTRLPCHGGWRFPGTAFPFLSNCHPGPCGLKVHHEIRDPAQDSVRRTHNARPAPGVLGPPVKPGDDNGKLLERHPECSPHHSLPLRQRKILRPAKSPAREQTAARTCGRKPKTPARERAKRRGAAESRPGPDFVADVFAKTNQRPRVTLRRTCTTPPHHSPLRGSTS